MAESLMAESFSGEEIRKDLKSEQDAPTTAWGETPQLRWVDQWLDCFELFVIFCSINSSLENPCESEKSVVRNSFKKLDHGFHNQHG